MFSDNLQTGRCFRVDYLSRTGKWLQLCKLLAVVFIPIFAGLAFTLHGIAENAVAKSASLEVGGHIVFYSVKSAVGINAKFLNMKLILMIKMH